MPILFAFGDERLVIGMDYFKSTTKI